jgi:hypothetical protein
MATAIRAPAMIVPIGCVIPGSPRGPQPTPPTHWGRRWRWWCRSRQGEALCLLPPRIALRAHFLEHRLQVNAPMLVGALRKSGQNGRFEAYLASPMRLLVASRLRLLAPRVQWRVSPKRGSNPRSPKASLAFLAGERAASGIMSAQAARALDASHRQRHPPGRRTPSGTSPDHPVPVDRSHRHQDIGASGGGGCGAGVGAASASFCACSRHAFCAQRASPQASSSDRPGDEMASHMLSERTKETGAARKHCRP